MAVFCWSGLGGVLCYHIGMSRENDETIKTYEQYAEQYLARNTTEEADKLRREMLKERLESLLKGAKIFEVGSAGGDDARFIKSLGFENVTASDVAEPFLDKMRKNGLSPIKFDLVRDNFPDKYDLIYCWAVLMHFTKEEAKDALKKIYEALSEGGRLLTCLKMAEAKTEEWTQFQGERGAKVYFSYWSEEELRGFLKEVGFRKIDIWGYGNWLDCWAEK